MVTFDGKAYDLQGVGEFVAARASDGHEVQIRTGPFEGRPVSITTAVAANVEGARVSIHQLDYFTLRFYVDDELVELGRGESVAVGDGGALTYTGEVAILMWADGSQLNVTRSSWLDVSFSPADRSMPWEGLFGSADGNGRSWGRRNTGSRNLFDRNTAVYPHQYTATTQYKQFRWWFRRGQLSHQYANFHCCDASQYAGSHPGASQ